MSYSKKQREEYNQNRDRISKNLGINKNEYNRLRRISNELHRNSEDYSMGRKDWRYNKNDSGGSKQYSEKEYSKDTGKAFKRTKALERAKKGGKRRLHYYHQTDPRGTALYAGKERMNQMNYNSKGYPIY